MLFGFEGMKIHSCTCFLSLSYRFIPPFTAEEVILSLAVTEDNVLIVIEINVLFVIEV